MKHIIPFIVGILTCLLILVFLHFQGFVKLSKSTNIHGVESSNSTDLKTHSSKDISEHTQAVHGSNVVVATQKSENTDWSESIVLNGEVLVTNDHAGLYQAYSNADAPQIVIAWSDCGGSSCGRASTTFIDLTTTPPFHATLNELSAKTTKVHEIKPGTYKITGRSNYMKNSLGDLLNLEVLYNRKNKTIEYQSKYSTIYDSIVNTHPDTLLGDENARKIFLNQMTPEQFKDFRHAMSVSSTVKKTDFGRTLIASGIAPHSGGDPSSFFVIDVLHNNFVSGYFESGNYTFYSDKKLENMTYATIEHVNKFLSERGMVLDYETYRAVPK